MNEDRIKFPCGCEAALEPNGNEWRLHWNWPCADHRKQPYKCEAIEYLDSYKTHGCIKIKCKTCAADYCPHYPKCPRCLFRELK